VTDAFVCWPAGEADVEEAAEGEAEEGGEGGGGELEGVGDGWWLLCCWKIACEMPKVRGMV
jgi:hypothetical protein